MRAVRALFYAEQGTGRHQLGRSHICLCLAERAADNPENLKSRSYGLEVTDPFFFRITAKRRIYWISRSLEEGKYIGMCVSGSVHSGPRPLLLL